MQPDLYSIRMRAARGGAHEYGGRHISGAERIVREELKKVLDITYAAIKKITEEETLCPEC